VDEVNVANAVAAEEAVAGVVVADRVEMESPVSKVLRVACSVRSNLDPVSR